jgi:PTS system nitrogen regulatory IIA component
MIALCLLENPVDFGSIDRKPVQVLFTILSPTVRAHLHMLSRLMYLLHDKPLRTVLSRQGSRDEILEHAARVEDSLPRSPAGSAVEARSESKR